ncbi:hypothetical protein [Halomonas mongoliensis]|uniref:hypothetical protein n=1 Tax=Halomonas mongoliensis TaxID=321265 RepID=UPI00403AD258
MADDRLPVALHEAGHLLAAWWNGQIPEVVELRRYAEGRPRLSNRGVERGPEVRAFVQAPRFIAAPKLLLERPELQGGELSRRHMREMVARDLLTALAGPAVEWRLQLDPECLHPSLADMLESEPDTCWGDLEQARELLALLPDGEKQAAFSTACRRAAALVCRYWPELCALGERLFAEQRLEDEALHSVLSAALGDVSAWRCQPLEGLDHAARLGSIEVVAWWERDEVEAWRLSALVDDLPMKLPLEVARLDAEVHAELGGLPTGWYCLNHTTGEIHAGPPPARSELHGFFAGLVVHKLEELQRAGVAATAHDQGK